jgi:pimeloyl-ACP methyl ester carboxylesterase
MKRPWTRQEVFENSVLGGMEHGDSKEAIRMATQLVNGINMYYEIHGEGEPLVLIMGLRRNIEWWHKQIPALSRHFRLLVFDNRGAGRSDKPEMDYSIRLFAEDTAELMHLTGMESANVLGYSMGGYIAQELAINHPGMVRKLVLASTSAGGERTVLMSPERMSRFTANEGLTPEEILRKDMDIYFSDEYILNHPDEIREFIEISLRWYQPADAFLRQFQACLKHDAADRLHQIGIPVLILSGGDDSLVPPENSKILKELLPHADLTIYPGLRHSFLMEDSDSANKKILDFLA